MAFSADIAEPTAPAQRHFTISPNDTNPVSPCPRTIYFQTAGDVSIEDDLGVIKTYTGAAGSWLPFRPYRVRVSGTTATVIGWI